MPDNNPELAILDPEVHFQNHIKSGRHLVYSALLQCLECKGYGWIIKSTINTSVLGGITRESIKCTRCNGSGKEPVSGE